MWGWIVRLFSSQYEPLGHPPPLSGACGPALDAPDMQRVRDIQHDADNVITGVRGWRDMRQRRPDLFIENMRDAWRGVDPHDC